MGLPTEERNQLRVMFGPAFSFKYEPDAAYPPPTVLKIDFMKMVKRPPPKDVRTWIQYEKYLCDYVKYRMARPDWRIRVCVLFVDGPPHPVKSVVEHGRRYKNKTVLSFDALNPRAPPKDDDPLPENWADAINNWEICLYELYPRLFNCFMNCKHFRPAKGQSLFLSGFPGRCEWKDAMGDWHQERSADNMLKLVRRWAAGELPVRRELVAADPDLFNRAYVVENIPESVDFPRGCLRVCEFEGGSCGNLSESDVRIPHWDHHFPNETTVVDSDDGDLISILLLYAQERLRFVDPTGKHHFRNRVLIVSRCTRTKDMEFLPEDKRPKEEFIDINSLYEQINKEPAMVSAGVQHPVATMVFLLIMAGTDFFRDFMMGLGTQAVMWHVFFKDIKYYTHLVQLSNGVPPTTRGVRDLWLDEELFLMFVSWCYYHKYGESTVKMSDSGKLVPALENPPHVTIPELRRRTQLMATGKPNPKVEYHLPEPNTMRLWARQVRWNFLYWKNAPLGNPPDPFELWYDVPYYPYWNGASDGKPRLTDVVSAMPKPVPEVFRAHLFHRAKRARSSAAADVAEQRKRRVVDAFG